MDECHEGPWALEASKLGLYFWQVLIEKGYKKRWMREEKNCNFAEFLVRRNRVRSSRESLKRLLLLSEVPSSVLVLPKEAPRMAS